MDKSKSDKINIKAAADLALLSESGGTVSTIQMAVQIAEPVLKAKFGETAIERMKPLVVNLEDEVWTVQTYLENSDNIAFVQINKTDGKIITKR